jgi:CRP/FNR family transcriptional regulator, cyclic AMP receptor protein
MRSITSPAAGGSRVPRPKVTPVSDPDDLLKFLPGIALFGGLEEGSLKRVIAMLGEHRLEPGAEVCKEGDVGRSMFLVRRGEVVVTRTTENGRRVRMVRLGEGEFFGEMTLIDIQKRSATVIVEKPSLLYSLGNPELFKLYQEDVAGYVMIIQNICRELSRRLRSTNKRITEMAAADEDESTQIRPAVKRKPIS